MPTEQRGLSHKKPPSSNRWGFFFVGKWNEKRALSIVVYNEYLDTAENIVVKLTNNSNN
jgi:hypothetical protein